MTIVLQTIIEIHYFSTGLSNATQCLGPWVLTFRPCGKDHLRVARAPWVMYGQYWHLHNSGLFCHESQIQSMLIWAKQNKKCTGSNDPIIAKSMGGADLRKESIQGPGFSLSLLSYSPSPFLP